MVVGSEILTPDRLAAELRVIEISANARSAGRVRVAIRAANLSVTTHAADLGGQLREEP